MSARAVLLITVLGVALAPIQVQAANKQSYLTLDAAVSAAHSNDIWQTGNKHSQEAIQAASVAAGTLPDPAISIAFANLPVDTFDFDQEGMTQFKVGVSQMFPKGDSLAIKKKQLTLKGQQFPYQRQDRQAKTTVIISQLWLNAFKAQQSIALIEKDRALFEQLIDVAQARYSTALGKTRQYDIVRAQLEMTRLENRLTMLRQQYDRYRYQLNEWFSEDMQSTQASRGITELNQSIMTLPLASKLPAIPLLNETLRHPESKPDPQKILEAMALHPALKALNKKIDASTLGIDLANQKYKPAWGVNGSYAYRDNDEMGNERADFFSIGVSFDLPVFTAQRQDQQVKEAISLSEAIKTEKHLLLRKMLASYETARIQLLRLNQRQALYHSTLLPQIDEQAEAALTAYTNDEGDFAEVVRARIAQLDAGIDSLSINVDRQILIAQLNYFFADNNEKSN